MRFPLTLALFINLSGVENPAFSNFCPAPGPDTTGGFVGRSASRHRCIPNSATFLDRDWGRKFFTDGVELLEPVGYDEAHDREIYVFHRPKRHTLDVGGTRWQARLRVKYSL